MFVGLLPSLRRNQQEKGPKKTKVFAYVALTRARSIWTENWRQKPQRRPGPARNAYRLPSAQPQHHHFAPTTKPVSLSLYLSLAPPSLTALSIWDL